MPTTLPCVQFHRRLLFPREETNNMIIRQHLYRKLYQWLRSSRWITTLRQLNEIGIKIIKEMILVSSKMDMCPWTMWDASWILGNSIRHWKKLSAEYIIYLDWSRNIYPWYRNFTGGDWWVRRCHIDDGIFCFSSIWYVLLRLCYLSALRTNQKGERNARVVPKQFGPLPKYIYCQTPYVFRGLVGCRPKVFVCALHMHHRGPRWYCWNRRSSWLIHDLINWLSCFFRGQYI